MWGVGAGVGVEVGVGVRAGVGVGGDSNSLALSEGAIWPEKQTEYQYHICTLLGIPILLLSSVRNNNPKFV
jgi:hypothetical protein